MRWEFKVWFLNFPHFHVLFSYCSHLLSDCFDNYSRIVKLIHLRIKDIFQLFKFVKLKSSNFQFMFSWRYWSHIRDFQEFIRRIFWMFRHAYFPFFPIFAMLKIFKCPQINCFDTLRGVSCIFWNIVVSPKVEIFGFGTHGHTQKSDTHENNDLSGFSATIILRSFWVIFSENLQCKQPPRPPKTPNLDFFRTFRDFPIGTPFGQSLWLCSNCCEILFRSLWQC